MKIEDVMTRHPVVVSVSDRINRAAEVMRDLRIGLVPVVDDEAARRLRGVITARDIVVRCIAEHHFGDCWVGDHATRDDVVVVRPEQDAHDAVAIMRRLRLRRLPVVDADGRLVGVVTWSDVAGRLAAPPTAGTQVRGVSLGARSARSPDRSPA